LQINGQKIDELVKAGANRRASRVLARQGARQGVGLAVALGACRSTAEFGPEYDLSAKCNFLASAPVDSKNSRILFTKGLFCSFSGLFGIKNGSFYVGNRKVGSVFSR